MRTVVLACALIACGSDDTDTMNRDSGCELDIVISGGYSWSSEEGYDLVGCGAAGGPTGASIGVELDGPGENDKHGASVEFTTPILMGQTGTMMVTVEVE